MKWTTALLLAAAVTVIFGLPFREYDTQRLLPIKTVQVEKDRNGVHIVSEVGEGRGASWAEAVADLRANAPGDVFFETAEQVVFCSWQVVCEAAESGDLRPAAQVYFADGLQEPEGLNTYLSAHETSLTVADLRAGTPGGTGL